MRAVNRGRIGRGLVIGIMIAGAAAACGGDDASSDTDAPSATATGESPESDAARTTGADNTPETTAAPGEGVHGGEMIVGVLFDAFGLDPATLVGQSTDASYSSAVYDNLMTYSDEGEPIPWLAESMTTTDQQTWTIKLRPGVTFHDGTPLDAEAVKFNLERHKDPAIKSRNINNARNITTATVVDPLTLELQLAFPWAAFDEIIMGNLGLIASPTSIRAGTNSDHPVGTGPFRFVERIPGDRMVFERNENYWRTGEPYLDKITYRVMLDDEVRFSSVETGEIDAAQAVNAGDLIDAEEAEGTKSSMSVPRANTIHLNNASGPTADVRVRQALARAIDYDALNDVISGGAAPSQHHFITATSPYFDESVEFPTYDIEGARALIEEYEAENGPIAITFSCYTGPTRVQLSQLVEQMWTAAGVDVEVKLSDQSTHVTEMLSGAFQTGCLSTNAETVDPDLLYYNAYHSTSTSGNYGKYSDPEMDAALDLGRTSGDEAERAEAYSTVQRLLARDIPTIVWSSGAYGWITGDHVEGLQALPGTEFRPGTVFLSE